MSTVTLVRMHRALITVLNIHDFNVHTYVTHSTITIYYKCMCTSQIETAADVDSLKQIVGDELTQCGFTKPSTRGQN